MKTGKQILIKIGDEKVLVTEIFLENISREEVMNPGVKLKIACDSCCLRKIKKGNKFNSPVNCLSVAPSCMAHQRKDRRSVYYKIINDADKA